MMPAMTQMDPAAQKHVAIYVAALSGGGAERVAALLASGFDEAGWRVTLLVDFDAAENEALVRKGVAIKVLGRSHIKSMLSLARVLRRSSFDIALSIGGGANVKLTLARFLSMRRLPVVLSYHGRSGVGHGRLGHAAYSFASWLAARARAVVCVSDMLRDHMRDDWQVPAGKLVRIYNPVLVEKASPATLPELAGRPPVVLGMGRLTREKGFDALIAALPRMRTQARLVIFGDGPEREALMQQARALNLADRLSLPGYAADPWPCYATARCFAITSASEAFGNVVVEALASGLPVVATRSGGPEEILAHGRFGRLVDNGDIAALAEALDATLEAPGDPAPRIARAHEFDIAHAVRAYLELFTAVLASPSRGVPAGPARPPTDDRESAAAKSRTW